MRNKKSWCYRGGALRPSDHISTVGRDCIPRVQSWSERLGTWVRSIIIVASSIAVFIHCRKNNFALLYIQTLDSKGNCCDFMEIHICPGNSSAFVFVFCFLIPDSINFRQRPIRTRYVFRIVWYIGYGVLQVFAMRAIKFSNVFISKILPILKMGPKFWPVSLWNFKLLYILHEHLNYS